MQAGLRALLHRRVREIKANIDVVLKWRPGWKDGAEILNLGTDGRYVVTAKLSRKAAIVSSALPGLSLILDQVFAATP